MICIVFSNSKYSQRRSLAKMVAPCGGRWALQRCAFRDRNDHYTPGSSYVSDTALF